MKPLRSWWSRIASAASCSPAIQPSVRASNAARSAAVSAKPHHLIEKGRSFVGREAQIVRVQLGHGAARAQARERQRRIGAREDHQVQLGRQISSSQASAS